MTLTQKIIKEFEKEFCNNHQKPIRFLRSIFYDEQDGAEKIENFLYQSLHQIATEAIEAVKVEKKEMSYSQEEQKVLEEIFGKYEIPEYLRERIYGYNSAISEMEQKAKKFLENNF